MKNQKPTVILKRVVKVYLAKSKEFEESHGKKSTLIEHHYIPKNIVEGGVVAGLHVAGLNPTKKQLQRADKLARRRFAERCGILASLPIKIE